MTETTETTTTRFGNISVWHCPTRTGTINDLLTLKLSCTRHGSIRSFVRSVVTSPGCRNRQSSESTKASLLEFALVTAIRLEQPVSVVAAVCCVCCSLEKTPCCETPPKNFQFHRALRTAKPKELKKHPGRIANRSRHNFRLFLPVDASILVATDTIHTISLYEWL